MHRPWSSKLLRRTRTAAFYAVTFAVVAAGAIWLALRVRPLQTVSAAGQTAQVGATLPNASLRGPGELDLFGQVMATKPDFAGPIRPRLALEHITIDPQVIQMLRASGPSKVELTLSQQLAAGWEHYFLWETLIAVGFAVIPLVAVAAVRKRPAIWKLLAGGIAVVVAVNVGGIALTASGTPKVLRSVKTLDDLVGVDPLTGTTAAGAAQPGVQAVVIGDSTAAGWGLPWGPNPTAEDKACGRSPRVVRGGPGGGQPVERAQPGVRQRDDRERPARPRGALQRRDRAAAAAAGRGGYAREADHRQRGGGRPVLVGDDPAVRGVRPSATTRCPPRTSRSCSTRSPGTTTSCSATWTGCPRTRRCW